VSDRPRVFVLWLTSAPGGDGIPIEVRLRRASKYLLRATCLRCLDVREEQPGDDQGGDDSGQGVCGG
jgi:hypothetical protein